MLRSAVAILALTACLAGAARAQTSYDRDIELRAIEHDGVRRTVGLYAPTSYSPERPAPLIVALHGRFSSAKAFHALSGLAGVADARGAIVIYPETAGAFWNDGGHEILRRREPPQDDAGFIAAAIEALAREYAIDRERVFVAGYDSGGAMAYRLACAGGYAGVAVVSALMWDYQAQACAPAGAAPMLIVHGRRDEYAPVRGGSFGAEIAAERLGAEETLEFWRRRNGCADARAQRRGARAASLQCAGGAVAYVGVDGGNHDWFREGDRYQLNRHGVDATALIESFFFDRSAFDAPRSRGGTRRSRSWLVYVPPSYDPGRAMPAVVMLHGRGGNAGGMAAITQMNAVAARRGFIVVYPDGLGQQWNTHFDLVGQREVLPQDDVQFLENLMQDLALDLNIDTRRMYVAGFSNGGFMTLRMACSSTGHFAGFASVGAALYLEMQRLCRGGAPAPLLIMHGTGDPSIPYGGVVLPDPQGGDPRRITLSVEETVAFFIRRNQCSLSGASTTFAESGQSPGTHVIRFLPHDCAANAPVAFWLVNGGGHNWPGVPGVLDEDAFGPVNMDINAGEVIWEFFSQQSLP